MDRSRLAIIIPALNEVKTIERLVRAVSPYGLPIIVDDGSSDDTAQTARNAGAATIVHQSNQGYDSALNSGFQRASEIGFTYALTMDADGQHDPTVISLFIDALENGADVVVGVRDHLQRITEHVFATYTKLRWGIKDPLCGFKAYRLKIYTKLGHFDSYGSIGTELLLYTARNNGRIVQIPIKTQARIDNSRFGNPLKSNIRILRALFKSVP